MTSALGSDGVVVSAGPKRRRTGRGEGRAHAEDNRQQGQNSRAPGPGTLEGVLNVLAEPVATFLGLVSDKLPNPSRIAGVDWDVLCFTTSYSGIGCAEATMSMLQTQLRGHGKDISVRYYRAVDAAHHCREALLNHAPDAGSPEHVFADILARIPHELAQTLLQQAAAARAKIAEKVTATKMGRDRRTAADLRARMLRTLGESFVRDVRKALETVDFSSESSGSCHCYRHCQGCPASPRAPPRTFHLEVAGTTCVAWSSMGSHWGWLDSSGLVAMVWAYVMRHEAPDAVLHECTPNFDPALVSEILGDMYECSTMTNSPTLFGVPSRRTRRYTLFWKRSRNVPVVSCTHGGSTPCHSTIAAQTPTGGRTPEEVVEVGGRTPEEANLEVAGEVVVRETAFAFTRERVGQLFFRELRATSATFLVATAEEVEAYNARRAEARTGCALASSSQATLQDLVPPCARLHLAACEEIAAQQPGRFDIVCLMQSPYCIPPCQRDAAPPLLKGSLFWSLPKQRLVLPAELLMLQGFTPSLAALQELDVPASAFRRPLETMFSDHVVRGVLGNGMHAAQVGTAMLLVLGRAIEFKLAG